ncbi:Nonribosomal peptide synthase, partial [Ruminobacter amylophilus]
SSELFRVKEDPEHRHDPFPLTEVQQAYWMGQMQSLSLNSKTYYMVELTGSPLNRERLCHAFDLLKKRHEMLRAVITDDGMQTIRKQAAASDIPYFSVTDEQEACSSVSEWWDNLNKDSVCHPVAAAGFLYGTGMRLAIAFSYMNLDGYSVKLLLKDLAQAYNDPAGYENRPPLTLSFRDYVLSAVADESRIESARKYWDEKIAVMPNAPQLPLRCSPDTVEESHFIRLAHTVKNRDWHKLRAKASACGITPSAVLLHAYLATLSRYSGENDVTVNVTLFDRKRIHPEIMDITGDFTSLLPVSYTPDTSLTFADAARKTAENLAEGLDHRELSSIYIQRELSRKRGSGMASLPVIFTSTLGVSQNDEDASPADGFLQITEGGMSETPQVWLDHQLYEKQDGIYLTWDYVEGLFDPSTVREMFDCYLETVMNIADGEWNRPINPELSRKTADTRKRINSTGAPVSDTLLAERIFTNAETRPDSPAL